MEEVEFDISVKDLAEFVHRVGDLGGESSFRRSNRALEGIKGHKRVQESRGSDYQPEVPVEHVFIQDGVKLRVVGRVDGLVEGLVPLVEEIKTVERRWSREADPVHWAQLRLYTGILALAKGWRQASLQLTYLELDTQEIHIFREETSQKQLIAFLNETVQEWFSWLLPHLAWLEQRNASIAQRANMAEVDRAEFLAKFTETTGSVGLAVMGGIFSEGIDLPGEQLVGVTIIGVGLPGLSVERDLLMAYFDPKEKPGFDYAYRFPGMQPVLQAVGRLIRSENDEGAALLVDRRFLESRYEILFPAWWRISPMSEDRTKSSGVTDR